MGIIDQKKIWTGAVLVPLLLLLIVAGPPSLFPLLILLAVFLGLREYFQLCLPASERALRGAGMGLGVLCALLLSFGRPEMVFPFVAFSLFCVSVLVMAVARDLRESVSRAGIVLFGVYYVGFLFAHLAQIWRLPHGKQWALFLILGIWAGDIFAFFVGTLLGKHRLYPRVSPKKTWEGLAGAVAGSLLTGLVFASLWMPWVGMGLAAALAAALAVLGQAGDFIESMLKRSAQVKDSGTFIPGHGGMLDRIDSFLFSAPFLYYVLTYLLREMA
jgi:phosphatidate cytidylyltransferase